jgi:hypothetical protein
MASADRLFNARALRGPLDADAAEQLRHAALALAGMPPKWLLRSPARATSTATS